MTGEFYCKKWNELYKLDTLCLRFSNVYGPRQGTKGEGGVISIFMKLVLEGQTLTVYGDGNQTRDFIFVEDVTDAIYRCLQSDLTGIVNLSTKSEGSINELLSILGSLYPIKEIVYDEPRKGDIYRSCMDNTRIKQELDWVPMFTLEEGIRKTFAWFENYYIKK